MFILLPAPGAGVEFDIPHEECLRACKNIVGDDSLPLEILGISKWFINETVADYYSENNMYVLNQQMRLVLTYEASALAMPFTVIPRSTD